jgi:MerR family transcriptional regulator, copper efflux regulator
MTSMPIACTLTPAEQPARRKQMEALADDALLVREPISNGLRVLLRDAPDIEERVRDLAAAEARCCPFLSFGIRRERGAIVLDVTGPADARLFVREQFLAPDV